MGAADGTFFGDEDVITRHGALGSILSRSDLTNLPKVQPLIEGLISQPAAVVVIGAYGLGKTVLAHSVAGCVAAGTPWLGRGVRRRRTLVVVGEGAYGLDDRITAWEQAWNQGRPLDDNDLTFIIKPNSLKETKTWQQLTEYALAGDYGFVILDTYSSLAPDADETKDAPLIMRHLSDLSAAINGTALLVHHPGWSDSTRARGGYQFEANADEVLILTGVADEPLVCVTRKKVKDGPSGATIWLRRKPSHGSVIFEWAQPSDSEVPIQHRILAVLDAYGEVGGTGPQVMDECGLDKQRSAFYKALGKLHSDQSIVTTGKGRGIRYYAAAHAPDGAM